MTAPATVDLGAMTADELRAELARSKKDNEALAAKLAVSKKAGAFSARVNEVGKKNAKGETTVGGNVSITGLGRFPVSLYGSQVITLTDPENILTVLDTAIEGFGHLTVKGTTEAEKDEARKTLKASLLARREIYAQVVAAIKKNKKA